MVGLTEASAAFGGLKTAYELAKGMNALTTDAKVKLATIELMETILAAQQNALAAQEAQATLLKRVSELEMELGHAKAWSDEQERYELKEFPAGTFAYVLRESHANGETSHRICQQCYEDGQKSVLQTTRRLRGGEEVVCNRCKMSLTLVAPGAPALQSRPDTRYY